MEDAESVEERARLIATASLLLEGLKHARACLPATADVRIVERWITRVAGIQANLEAVTEWDAAEAYEVNPFHPGEPLGRLFPRGLDDADFETELQRLERELAGYVRELETEPPTRPMSADEGLVDVLTGHASARFRYLDVRSVDLWRRERLPVGTNIPIDRLADEAPKVFRRETDLVVYGEDAASTEAAGRELKSVGFESIRTIPDGFEWFRRRGWPIETGPGR